LLRVSEWLTCSPLYHFIAARQTKEAVITYYFSRFFGLTLLHFLLTRLMYCFDIFSVHIPSLIALVLEFKFY